jgi:hypothetical protein
VLIEKQRLCLRKLLAEWDAPLSAADDCCST